MVFKALKFTLAIQLKFNEKFTFNHHSFRLKLILFPK